MFLLANTLLKTILLLKNANKHLELNTPSGDAAGKSLQGCITQGNVNNHGKDYSVAVVATMSAGKSTLLNAIIGKKLLPSKLSACTAKVYSIKDNDNSKSFMARAIENGKAGEWQPATLKLLQILNESSADKIEICGNIKAISNMSSGNAVLFYDTPGPNHSRDITHSEIANDIIRNSDYSSLICVLNPTQLGTNDEFNLLSFIRNEVEKRDNNTDVVFVLNKVDEYSLLGSDSIQETLSACKRQLKDAIGFSNMTFLPVCSRLALLIRLLLDSNVEDNSSRQKSFKMKCPQTILSEEELDELACLLKKFKRHERIFAESLQFSPQMKQIFNQLKDKFTIKNDEHNWIEISDKFFSVEELNYALLLSGVPILEQYLQIKLKEAAI